MLFQIMGWRYETKVRSSLPTDRLQNGAGCRRSDGCNRNLDRLMHPCPAIAINGDSYRLKEHKLN
ncbi:hypothetical protein [Sutterella wadsworthensis]|uniref:hypothetical protein n=1 Tax=Sutterella wadsworthensis TaxID=40545 RepID=UPI003FED810C